MPSPAEDDASGIRSQRRLASYFMRATIVNWLATVLSIVYALVLTPLVVSTLGKDLYGVWSFLNGLLAYSSLFYVGLGAAFIKYLAQYRAANDAAAVNRLASVVFVIYSLVGCLCLVLCIAIAPWTPGMFAEPLMGDAARQSVISFTLLGFRLLFMFVATVFSGILIAEERITIAASVNIAGTLARFVAVPLTLSHGVPLVTLAMIMTIGAALEAGAMHLATRRMVPTLRLVPAVPRLHELRQLYGFGFKAFFLNLSTWLINYTDVLIIGVLIGAAGVAIYSLPLQLVTYGRLAVEGMISPLLPRLTAYQTTGNLAALASAYVRVSRITSFVAAFITLNLLSLGVPFLRLWVGEEFISGSVVIVICLGLAGFSQALSTQTAIPFYQAMHALRFPVVVLLTEAAANSLLSIWWARRFGIEGVAVATLVPALLITFILLPRDLCHKLQIRPQTLFRSAVLPSVCLLSTGVLLNLVIDRAIPADSYFLFGLRGVINVCIAAGVAVLMLPPEDMTVLRSMHASLRFGLPSTLRGFRSGTLMNVRSAPEGTRSRDKPD